MYDMIKLIKIAFKYTTEKKLIIIITNLNEMRYVSRIDQLLLSQFVYPRMYTTCLVKARIKFRISAFTEYKQ
jgi:hypothetical protein